MASSLTLLDELVSTFSFESVMNKLEISIATIGTDICQSCTSNAERVSKEASLIDRKIKALEKVVDREEQNLITYRDHKQQNKRYRKMNKLRRIERKLLDHLCGTLETKMEQLGDIRESFSKLRENCMQSVQNNVVHDTREKMQNLEGSMIEKAINLHQKLHETQSSFIMNGKNYYDTNLFHKRYIIGRKLKDEATGSLYAAHPNAKCVKIFDIQFEKGIKFECIGQKYNEIEKERNKIKKIFVNDSVEIELYIDSLLFKQKANAYIVLPCYIPTLISGFMNWISKNEYMFPSDIVSIAFGYLFKE